MALHFTHVMHEKASGYMTLKSRRITSMRIDVDTTLFWHQMRAGPDGLTLHNLIRVYILLDTLKGEKERLINL